MVYALLFIFSGILTGILTTKIYIKRHHVGTLRIDSTEPDEGSYFFLELDSGKAFNIQKKKNGYTNGECQ